MRAQKGGQHALPEDLGRQVAFTLLEELQRGGVADSSHQVQPLLVCAQA